jgi:hypothetical protein
LFFSRGGRNNGWDNQKTTAGSIFMKFLLIMSFSLFVIKREKKVLRLGFRVGIPGVVLFFTLFYFYFEVALF